METGIWFVLVSRWRVIWRWRGKRESFAAKLCETTHPCENKINNRMSIIKIKVDFYDKGQKDLIEKNFPKDFEIIKDFVGKTVDVSLEDFKTYAYFKHQYSKNGRLASFLDLKPMAQNWGHYDTYFELKDDDKLVNIFPDVRIEATDVSEMIGVAGGLSVASSMYGLTQADWTKIPITTAHKDFDFSHTSSLPNRFINIEAKGSVIDDNSYKAAPVSLHKSSIITKKNDTGFKKKYVPTRDSNIGIITVADRNKNLQSWLVDPPLDDFEISPIKYKLLKRLYFYHSILRLISKRSYITLTLANRIRAIELTNDYDKLDKTPLLNYNFDKVNLTESFINSRSRNKENDIIGNTFLINKNIFFIGVPADLILTLINQNFSDILSLKRQTSTALTTLNCKISKRRGKELSTLNNSKIRLKKEQSEEDNYIFFEMDTDLIQNSGGLCIARQQ